MQRRAFIKNSSSILAALALFSNKTVAQLLADPTWTIKMLTDDIGIFTEKGGTILFMLSKEGLVVVDSQFPETSQHLIDELKKKSQQPRGVLNQELWALHPHLQSRNCLNKPILV